MVLLWWLLLRQGRMRLERRRLMSLAAAIHRCAPARRSQRRGRAAWSAGIPFSHKPSCHTNEDHQKGGSQSYGLHERNAVPFILNDGSAACWCSPTRALDAGDLPRSGRRRSSGREATPPTRFPTCWERDRSTAPDRSSSTALVMGSAQKRSLRSANGDRDRPRRCRRSAVELPRCLDDGASFGFRHSPDRTELYGLEVRGLTRDVTFAAD